MKNKLISLINNSALYNPRFSIIFQKGINHDDIINLLKDIHETSSRKGEHQTGTAVAADAFTVIKVWLNNKLGIKINEFDGDFDSPIIWKNRPFTRVTFLGIIIGTVSPEKNSPIHENGSFEKVIEYTNINQNTLLEILREAIIRHESSEHAN